MAAIVYQKNKKIEVVYGYSLVSDGSIRRHTTYLGTTIREFRLLVCKQNKQSDNALPQSVPL